MLADSLKNFMCPICKTEDEEWELPENLHNKRILDGQIICKLKHIWVIKNEVLRFDRPENDEHPIYPDRDLTGFPARKFVSEEERGDFLKSFEKYVNSEKYLSNKISLSGDIVLFCNYLYELDVEIALVNPN